MQRVNFITGEHKYVRLLIKAVNNQVFAIHNATWELIKNGTVEAFGDCIIDDHIINAFISPADQGGYKLKITYQVANEILIEVVEVSVREYG